MLKNVYDFIEIKIQESATDDIKAYRFLKSAVKLASEKFKVDISVINDAFGRAATYFNKEKAGISRSEQKYKMGEIKRNTARAFDMPYVVLNAVLAYRSARAKGSKFSDEKVKGDEIKTVLPKAVQTSFEETRPKNDFF